MNNKTELLQIELDFLRLKVIEEKKDFGDSVGYNCTERAYAIGKMDAKIEILTEVIYKLKGIQNENTGTNISVDMMREELSQTEWERLRDLFWKTSSVPPEKSGLINLNCFIEGYMAAKEEEKQKREDRIRDIVDSMPDANDEDDG